MKKIIVMLLALMPLAAMAQTGKFGHIDSQAIMQAMPEFIKVRGEIEAEAKQYENEMTEMQKELQAKAEKYDKEKATMNATTQQQTEQSLQEMYQKIQQYNQDASQTLQQSEQEKMTAISEKLSKAINDVGTAGGFTAIFVEGSMPYISTTLCTDVTAQVKAKLGLK